MVQPPPRKRNRKRKRKAASLSSSSSSSDSSSESEPQPEKKTALPEPQAAGSSSSSSSSSSESESDSSDSEINDAQPAKPVHSNKRSRSPTPVRDVPIPSFLPSQKSEDSIAKEQELKDKFRKFWMSTVADGFKDDLEEIRKEPNLSKARLALLVDSLASGADVFVPQKNGDVNEMDVVLQ